MKTSKAAVIDLAVASLLNPVKKAFSPKQLPLFR
jgi:hypothetical protein